MSVSEELIKNLVKQPHLINNKELLDLIEKGEIISEVQFLDKDGELIGTGYDPEFQVVDEYHKSKKKEQVDE